MEALPPIENPTAGDISTRALMALLVYFGKAYGEERLQASIKRANLGPKVDLNYLRDENNWVSFNAGQRLIDVLDEDSNKPDFIRMAGLITATRESVGFVFGAFKAFGDPRACYIQLFKSLPIYNRVGVFRILELRRNYLCFSYHSSVIEPNERFSEFRMYQFASFPTLWGLPPADAKLVQRQVTGTTQTFLYELRWTTPRSNLAVIAGVLDGALMVYLGFLFLGITGGSPYIFTGSVIGGLIGLVFEQRRMLRERNQMLKDQGVDILNSINALHVRYEEVQTLNVSLEQKVEARTTELKSANERLKELDKLKDRFLANISHELRTPLVALSSTLQSILDGNLQDAQAQRTLLHSGQDALDDMLENINDLLLKSRSERAMLEMRWSLVDMGSFTQTVVNLFAALAEKSRVRLVFDNRLSAPLLLYADRPKLKKILNNLLGNALKFTKQGEVGVRLEKTGAHCRLMVTDTGSGIPENELTAIFEPFFQASNNPYRDVQGTGIGLSLVKDLVQLHHGEILVESRLGQGSGFTILFPLGEAHVDWERFDAGEVPDMATGREMRGFSTFDELDLTPFVQQRPDCPHVLLVEDNPQIIQVLAYVLKDEYQLSFAKDGQDGIEQARANKPDLIISDIMMPRKDGYALIHEIRADLDLKDIPIILLTSKADHASRLKGFEQGADEYLSKPFDNDEVRLRVKGLLEKRNLQIELIHFNKIIAIGQLAAGVAHEINNPLAYAQSSADTIGRIFRAVESGNATLQEGMRLMSEAIGRVQEGTARVAGITDALRGFVLSGAVGFQYYDIHPGINATLKIVHVNHKAAIRFVTQYQLDKKVECNINQLNQVFMNLLHNAAQALADIPDGEITIHTFRQGVTAHIHIKDNGPGIAKAQLNRVFEPFFTTKPLGMGVGLGLHISRQIVYEHGGTLTLENQKSAGVLCKIALPIKHNGDSYGPARYTRQAIDRRLEATRYPHY